MKLSSLLTPEHILIDLEARTIVEAVPELLSRAVGSHGHDAPEVMIEAVLHREEQCTTAMGDGIALPHARIPVLKDMYVLFGRPNRPLEDKGLDGQPVEFVFLLVSSNQKNTVMLQTMAAIGLLIQEKGMAGRLREASSSEALWRLVDESGVAVRKGLFARDLMRKTPFVARPEMPLHELLDLFFEHNIFSVPVCLESGEIVGAISSAEIIDAGFPKYLSSIPHLDFLSEYEPFEQFFKKESASYVKDVLDSGPLVVEADDPMIQVVFGLKQQHAHHAYVQEDGRFVGVIGRNDIISRILRA